jgi:hypothetical protein
MQRGSLIRKNHKEGPDVWQFRWSEKSPEGRRVYRKRVIGTVEQYPSEDAARRAVVGLVAEINSGDRSVYSNSMTVSQLSDHFEQRELGRDNTWRSYATKKSYHICLKRNGGSRVLASGARLQSSGWSLIRCGGVFFLCLTAYDVVRQEAPDDHFLKGSSREARATQGRSGSDQRSPSRFSHRPIPQVRQDELPLRTERLPGTRPLLLADSCQRWKDHHPSHPPRTGGRSYPGADR